MHTSFFNSLVNGRRKRFTISRIMKENGQWVEGNKQVDA